MRKRKNVHKMAKNPLDNGSEKRGRGRPRKIDASSVRAYADGCRHWLERNWNDLGVSLLSAKTEEEISKALQKVDWENLIPRSPSLILNVLMETKFPKRKKAQINFLADSIAGGGTVTPRRSRDICAQQRKADAQRHYILRYEYWIECSCGYRGQSQNHCCKKCGAVLYISSSNSEFI